MTFYVLNPAFSNPDIVKAFELKIIVVFIYIFMVFESLKTLKLTLFTVLFIKIISLCERLAFQAVIIIVLTLK